MSRAALTLPLTLPPAALARAMGTWTGREWGAAVEQWSEALHAAVVHEDAGRDNRVTWACRRALKEERWDVVWELFPHTPVNLVPVAGYALVACHPSLTDPEIMARRPSQLGAAALARAIMFEAAAQLDGNVVNQMVNQGASLSDQNPDGTTVVGVASRHLELTPSDQSHRAQTLITQWWSAQPKSSWSLVDIRRVAGLGTTDWLLETLGRRPLLPHLYQALTTAMAFGRADVTEVWLPQVIARAQVERERGFIKRPAAKCLETVLRTAALNQVEASRFRPWTQAIVHACGSLDLTEVFEAASNNRQWESMDTLWPHVQPEKVLALVLAHPTVDMAVVDWILVRAPKALRDEHAQRHATSQLPLTHARMEAEQRSATAKSCEPSRRSRRLRT